MDKRAPDRGRVVVDLDDLIEAMATVIALAFTAALRPLRHKHRIIKVRATLEENEEMKIIAVALLTTLASGATRPLTLEDGVHVTLVPQNGSPGTYQVIDATSGKIVNGEPDSTGFLTFSGPDLEDFGKTDVFTWSAATQPPADDAIVSVGATFTPEDDGT